MTQLARALARIVVEPALWPLIDEELQAELAEREDEGHGAGPNSLWGAAQYLSIAGRMGLDRTLSILPGRGAWRNALNGGWGLDFKVALRTLSRRPGTAATVIATLTLAVGATTSVFSVVDGVLLRPLPYPEPEQLVRIWQTREDWRTSGPARMREYAERMSWGAPTLREWSTTDLGFESLGGYLDASFVLQRGDRAEVVRGQEVTSGYFEALGLQPSLGRGLRASDDVFDAPRVAVVSEGFRREYLGNRSDPIGADLILDGAAHTVVGILPDNFTAPPGDVLAAPPPGVPRVWTPLANEAWHGDHSINVLARVRPGVSMEAAADRLASKQAAMGRDNPEASGNRGVRVVPLLESAVLDVRSTLWFLLASVSLVLVVATVNIVNLLTALGLTRRQDLAVRGALGAGRGRLVRGLFVESALLTVLGGAGGLLLAWVSLPLLVTALPASVPRQEMIGMSLPVLFFGLLISCGATLLVGVLPALLNGRAEPHEVIRASGRSATAGRTARKVRSALVMAEVSLAFVLLLGAALLANSYHRLWSVDRGFDESGLVSLSVVPDPAVFPGWQGMRDFNATLRTRLEAIPGVTATVANNVPLSGEMAGIEVAVDRDGEITLANALLSVGLENYFEVVDVPLVAGRPFTDRDTGDSPAVAVVNQAFARAFWPGDDPIGKRVRGDDGWTTVVGVAADVRHQGLATPVDPKVYLPSAQSQRDTYRWVLRVQGNLSATIEQATDLVASLSPTTPVGRVVILEQVINESVAVPRFRTLLIGALAGLAAVLALLGVYGVLSFAVAQRTKELGIRIALGAQPRRLVGGVVTSGLKLAAVGISVGLLVAWRAKGVMAEFLYEIAPTDLPTYVVIVLGLLVISGAAAYVPARRAASVDPTSVLNSQ